VFLPPPAALVLPLTPMAGLLVLAVAAGSSLSAVSTVIVKSEWERDESWFMHVAPTLLFFLPTYITMHLKVGFWSCKKKSMESSFFLV